MTKEEFKEMFKETVYIDIDTDWDNDLVVSLKFYDDGEVLSKSYVSGVTIKNMVESNQ